MADYITEMELDALTLHEIGMCGEYGPCQYCEEEDDSIWRLMFNENAN